MKTKLQNLCVACLAVAFLFSLGASIVQAETVGYWRFENDPGFLNDSSGNNLNLTALDGDGDSVYPVQYALPTTGIGSDFYDPIPQTGAANDYGTGPITHNKDGFMGADTSLLNFTDGFTVEFMFNRDYNYQDRPVFVHFEGTGDQRSFAVLLRKGSFGGGISLRLSSDGTYTSSGNTANYCQVDSSDIAGVDMSYDLDTDYYGAVSVDLSAKTATFYMKNLTDDGELLSGSIAITVESLFDASVPFYIGRFWGSDQTTQDDYLDEIRISNVALGAGDLYINQVPEPSTLALLGCGLIGLLAYAWRKRK